MDSFKKNIFLFLVRIVRINYKIRFVFLQLAFNLKLRLWKKVNNYFL